VRPRQRGFIHRLTIAPTLFRCAPRLPAVMILLAAVAGLIPWPAARAADRVVNVAVMEATPPFSYRESDGTLTGFNVEIMRELCRAMKASCNFEEVKFQDLPAAVSSGRYDYGLANFLRTPEREQILAFSAPYWRSSSSLIGSVRELEKPLVEAVRGRTVVVIGGSRQFAYMKRLEGELKKLVVVRHLENVWEVLNAQEADFTLLPTLAALPYLMSQTGKDFTTIGLPNSEDGLGGTVHVVMPKGRDDLKAAIDEAIGAIRVDGSYQRVNRQYFPFDVF